MVLIGSMLFPTQITELGLPSQGLEEEQARDAPNQAVFVGEPSSPRRFWQKPESGCLGLGENRCNAGVCVWRIDTGLTWDGAHTTFKREMVRDSSSEQSRSTPDTIYQVLSKWEEKETKLSQGLPI